jgi:hypothetical protein
MEIARGHPVGGPKLMRSGDRTNLILRFAKELDLLCDEFDEQDPLLIGIANLVARHFRENGSKQDMTAELGWAFPGHALLQFGEPVPRLFSRVASGNDLKACGLKQWR